MNSYLREAIHQGEALRECLDYYYQSGQSSLAEVVALFREKQLSRIILSGMGSSYYATFCVLDYLVQNHIPCYVVNSFELSRYQIDLVASDALLVVISQSGKSKEVLELVEKAKQRAPIVAVINKEDSLLAQQTDLHLWLKAGLETQITNKSFLCTMAVLNLLASALTNKAEAETKAGLYLLAEWIDGYMSAIEEHMPPLAKFVEGITNIELVANGPSFASAFQAGLTFREGPKIISTSSNCADYAHGWYKSVRPGYVCVMHSPTYMPDTVEARMVQYWVNSGAKVILLTASEVPSADTMYVVQHPEVAERLAPLAQIVVTTTLMGWLMGEKSDRE